MRTSSLLSAAAESSLLVLGSCRQATRLTQCHARWRRLWLSCAAVTLLSLGVLPPAVRAVEEAVAEEESAGMAWPWWRGPSRNGWAAADCSVPVRFGVEEHVQWRTPVPGRGHGSPIVVAGKVFLASADETQQTQQVLAYDLATGELLWQQRLSQGGFPERNHPKNTEASSTIACDGQRLFVTFFHHQQIQLTSLDLNGQTLWSRRVGPFDPKKYEYGYAPSPVLYQQSVIVSTEYDGPSALTAFDGADGRELWKTTRPSNISFSTPAVAEVAGRWQLLISGANQVCSYDPASGRPLWEVEGTTAATCGTIVWDGDLVFASGGYPKAETIAVMADGSGRVVWRNNQKCYEQSMIVVEGHLYALTDKGVLYCWRCRDGQEMWRTRLSGPVSASPIYVGGHIYWANEAGTIYVFRPNPQRFELVAENRLGDEAFASPAVVGQRLLLRVAHDTEGQRQEYLYCIGD